MKRAQRDLLQTGIYLWWRVLSSVSEAKGVTSISFFLKQVKRNKIDNIFTKGEGWGYTCFKKRQVSRSLGEYVSPVRLICSYIISVVTLHSVSGHDLNLENKWLVYCLFVISRPRVSLFFNQRFILSFVFFLLNPVCPKVS